MQCPNCGDDMHEGYFIVGGGVWWSRSREWLEHHVAGTQPSEELERFNREHPMHCIIGNQGYHDSKEKWPKHGHFCMNGQCLSMIIRPTPR